MKVAVVFFAVLFSLAYGQQDGTVALFRNGQNSPYYTSGIVQVYYDSQWEGICYSSSFDKNAADVICHQLGYSESQSFGRAGDSTYGSLPENSTVYSDVRCANSDYLTFFQCDYERDSCDDDMAVTVNCSSTRIWDDAYDGQVRLYGGAFTSEGTVEVYCNDQFGTVCSDSFGSFDADTTCRQLGYTDGDLTVIDRNQSQPIWYDDVSCGLFSQNCLSSCESCPSSDAAENCNSNRVVSVECSFVTTSSNSNTVGSCDFSDLAEAIRNLIAIVVGVLIAFCVCAIILAILPFCICCCLGVGIGAAVRSKA